MNMTQEISRERYESDQYLTDNPNWHVEDSAWKAGQIAGILKKNRIAGERIAEIGCGAGQVLNELQQALAEPTSRYFGFDIAPHAIELSRKVDNPDLQFECCDLLDENRQDYFDVLLAIDVFEHVPDYLGFVSKCRQKAEWKVYHIPLEIHLSSVLRNHMTQARYTVGHIHYFNYESAMATLKDTGHEIVDWTYTCGALDLYRVHPSFRRAVANLPRWLISRFSTAMASRLLGGYSLLVLAR